MLLKKQSTKEHKILKLFINEKKFEKEVQSGNSVRESINRRSVLPTADKVTQVKKEITGGAAAGAELNLDGVAGLS